jgi:hypothetical protein
LSIKTCLPVIWNWPGKRINLVHMIKCSTHKRTWTPFKR